MITTGLSRAAKSELSSEQGFRGMAAKAAAASAAAAAAALGSALAFAAAALVSADDSTGGAGGASNTCHCTNLNALPYRLLAASLC